MASRSDRTNSFSLSGDGDGESTDEGKRKRGEGGEERDIAKRNKKTLRTPPKVDNSLVEMMQQMMIDIKQIHKDNVEFRNEMREMRQENEELKEEIRKLQERVNKLEKVEVYIEKQEKQQRRNNIIITGMVMKQEMDNRIMTDELEIFLSNQLEVNPKVSKIQIIKEGMLLAVMSTFQDKMMVMRNKHKLKKPSMSKVYINDDLTYKERKIQEEIREKAKEKRARGAKTKVGYQYLVVDNVKWKWNYQTNQLEQERTSNTTPKN